MGILSMFFNKKKSKDTARDRLKIVLMHDRNDISPEIMEMLRRDIVQAISKYMEVDESVDCKLSNDEEVTALEVTVPVKGMKRGTKIMSEQAEHDED